jgi:multiple antibiotic resistance protein
MREQLQAIVTLLALINPAVCALIFVQLDRAKPTGAELADATRAAATVGVILALAALFGARALDAFGVSLDAFSVAGGGVLAWIGFSMLRGSPSTGAGSTEGASSVPSLTPLILFAASPGTITGVITVAVAHSRLALPITALVAVGVATFVLWAVLLIAIRAQKKTKARAIDTGRDRISSDGGFLQATFTSFMGLIVIAMGMQFALTGVRAFMEH